MRITSAAEMRQIDSESGTLYGVAELQLMENAGSAAFTVLLQRFNEYLEAPLIVAGPGNNGGDGFVVARRLISHGFLPEVLLAGEEAKLKGSARDNFQILRKLGVPIHHFSPGAEAEFLLERASMFVDALFGTGLAADVREPYAGLIDAMNGQMKPTLSLDIPSGVHADTGEILKSAVEASATVTFGLPKWGNLFFPGAAFGGELFVSHLSFPPALIEHDRLTARINLPFELPPRPPNGHKGTFGRLLVVGGSRRYLGAPRFAATAFLRAGGGMSYLGVPMGIAPTIAAELWEGVVVPLAETAEGTLSGHTADELAEILDLCDVVVAGPGLSVSADTDALITRLVAECQKPLIIDGDGLTLVAQQLDLLRNRRAPTILTPHPGEFCRLANCSPRDLQHNRLALLRDVTASTKSIVALKGAATLIADPSGALWLNRTGNSGMATAGSGDVLDGIIAACLAHGLPPLDAARMGVLLHGEAGDLAKDALGEDGILARDLIEALPKVLLRHREGIDELDYLPPVVERYSFPAE